jgi:anti-anti-sigma factor
MPERKSTTEAVRRRGIGRDVACVTVAGELDMVSVGVLEHAVADALADPADTAVELDLAGVSFMDSTGLRALLSARRRADAAGRRLRVVGAGPAVRRVLHLTRTAPLFELEPSD